MVVKRSLLDKVGYFNEDMGLRIVEDYELVLRLAAATPFHFIDEDLVLYRTQADSISADLFGSIDEYERVLNAIMPKFGVPEAMARQALCRLALRRYKHHLLRNYPRDTRLQDLRTALARRPGSPSARLLLLLESLRCANGLKWLLTVRARNSA
jgi:hypothetical protein